MTPFKLAYLSLLRHRFSTIITVLAIAISVACGGILLRLHQLSESRFAAMGNVGEAIIGAKAGGIEILLGSLNGEGSFPEFLPYALFETLRNEQDVTHADGIRTRSSYIEQIIPFVYFAKYNDFRVIGTDESFFIRKRKEDSLLFSEGRHPVHTNEVAIGATVAKTHSLKVGDTIQVRSWIGDNLPHIYDLKISGILLPTKSQWDRSLFSTVKQAHLIFENELSFVSKKSIWGSKVLNYYLVYYHPQGYKPLESLINKRTVGQVIHVEQQKQRLKELSGVGKSLGIFVTALVILLGGLAVCSMLITRFEAMSLQLAVLRALGYTKMELFKWLLWEGFLLGLIGILIGAMIDYLGLPILRSLLGTALPPADLIQSSIFKSTIIWVVALLAIIVSVFVPMFRIARQDIHHSLRGL